MKNWFNSDSSIIFNIVIALIVGIILGNFLGNSMIENEAIYANAVNYSDDIYLLQSGVYYDEDSAIATLNQRKQIGLSGIVVREHDNYYVYHKIAGDTNRFNEMTKILEDHQIDYLIKTKKLYFLLDGLDTESEEYDFYYKSINYYLSLVHDTQVVISDDYVNHVNEIDLELYNNINSLNQELDSQSENLYRLYVYRNLIDLLL